MQENRRKRKKSTSGKPSNLKWGKNEQHVGKPWDQQASDTIWNQFLGRNIKRQWVCIWAFFLFKIIEKIVWGNLTWHKSTLYNLPCSRTSLLFSVRESGLSWQMSPTHPLGLFQLLLPLCLPLPPLLLRFNFHNVSSPTKTRREPHALKHVCSVSSPVEREILGPKVRPQEKWLGTHSACPVTTPALKLGQLGRWNFHIKHMERSPPFSLHRNSWGKGKEEKNRNKTSSGCYFPFKT